MGTVDVWSGNILLQGGRIITDVFLESTLASPPLVLPSRNLRFLAVVEISRIPLYITAGPSLNAWTTSQETENWFSDLLHQTEWTKDVDLPSQSEWWKFGISQSPVGILAEVEAVESQPKSSRITEILFYSTTSTSHHGPPPPAPKWSFGGNEHSATSSRPLLRVHAIPLSSDLLYTSGIPTKEAQDQDSPAPVSGLSHHHDEAHFLVDSLQSPFVTHPEQSKRKEVSDMFESAAERRRKIRRTGGKGVAAAAVKINGMYPHSQHNRLSSQDAALRKPQANTDDVPTGVAPSEFGISDRSSGITLGPRPISRKGGSKSTLAGRSSLKTAGLPNDESSTVEVQNRDAISRIVMTSMRMYGLQQRKKTKKCRRSSTALANDQSVAGDGINVATDSSNDEEYKMVYHNTFKSTVFAFRNHVATEPLHSDPARLRDTVDRLLAIFCSDSTTTSFPPAITPSKANVNLSASASINICTPSRDGKLASHTDDSSRITESEDHEITTAKHLPREAG